MRLLLVRLVSWKLAGVSSRAASPAGARHRSAAEVGGAAAARSTFVFRVLYAGGALYARANNLSILSVEFQSKSAGGQWSSFQPKPAAWNTTRRDAIRHELASDGHGRPRHRAGFVGNGQAMPPDQCADGKRGVARSTIPVAGNADGDITLVE